MSKAMKQFLCSLVVLTAVGFGPLLAMGKTFGEIVTSPLGILLLGLGCLAPALSTVLIYVLNKEKGGLSQLWKDVVEQKKIHPWVMMLYFLFLHYGLAFLCNLVGELGSIASFLKALPIMFILMGSQEIGWRLILQPALEQYRGFWKSNIAMGMIVSLWFLPLLMIPGFMVAPNFYLVLAIYLVGLNLLQTTIRQQGGSILTCMVFTTLFYALNSVLVMYQSSNVMFLVIVDLVLAFTFKSKIFKENRKEQGISPR